MKKLKKNFIISLMAFLAFACVSIVILWNNKQSVEAMRQNDANQIVFFYGDGCSHCANVESFFTADNIAQKISFTEKEVFHNKQNALELEQKSKICGIAASNEIEVPFLWNGPANQCVVGDQNIINFFKQKTNS